MSDKPRYQINRRDVKMTEQIAQAAVGKSLLRAQKVYGTETSIMFAERGPGYHTRPHRHECEQINYIVEGEMWFFVEGQGYHCKKGDLMRIPRNRVHWAFNCSDQHTVIIESHSPCLIGNNAEARKTAVSLVGDDEGEEVKYVVNVVVDLDPAWVAQCEREAIGDAVLKWPAAERKAS